VREPLGDVVDRRLLAVDDAEAVRDVDVGQGGQLVGELGALGVDLGGLASVEPDVLEEGDLPVLQRGDRGPGGLTDQVPGEGDLGAEQLAEAPGHGTERVLGVRSALRTSEVGHDDDACPLVDQRLQRRQRGPDAPVVRDGLAVERHVEVGSDEHALAAQVAEGLDCLH